MTGARLTAANKQRAAAGHWGRGSSYPHAAILHTATHTMKQPSPLRRLALWGTPTLADRMACVRARYDWAMHPPQPSVHARALEGGWYWSREGSRAVRTMASIAGGCRLGVGRTGPEQARGSCAAHHGVRQQVGAVRRDPQPRYGVGVPAQRQRDLHLAQVPHLRAGHPSSVSQCFAEVCPRSVSATTTMRRSHICARAPLEDYHMLFDACCLLMIMFNYAVYQVDKHCHSLNELIS